MKKFRIMTILAALTLVFAALALTGCSNPFDPHRKGYTVKVVYDFNVYDYDVDTAQQKSTLLYKPESPIIEPEDSTSAILGVPSVKGMHITAWKLVETDENGNPKKDGEGKFVLSGDVDFSTLKTGEKGSSLYLLAVWGKNYTFTIDVGEEARKDGVENTVDSSSYSQPSTLAKPGGKSPVWKGHTFYYYYLDKNDDTTRINDADWENIEINDENPDITVYVKWLTGQWTIVTESSQIANLSENTNYILDNDIDFAVYGSDGKVTYTSMNGARMYNGTFDGNGYTIKNFVTRVEASGNNASNAVGLFPSFNSKAVVKNVTFENCVLNAELMARQESECYYIGFLCGNLMARTDPSGFENIKFTGCELNVTLISGASGYNAIVGESNYFGVFGQIADENKTKFVLSEENRGITVKINNKEIQNKGD